MATAATTDYVYDPTWCMIAEANGATGAMIREYIWMDDMPVAMVDDTGAAPVVYDIHTDHLGRPQKLTDQSGNVVWDGVFDPFGNPSGISGSVTMLLGFPGQYRDSETYSPRTGTGIMIPPSDAISRAIQLGSGVESTHTPTLRINRHDM